MKTKLELDIVCLKLENEIDGKKKLLKKEKARGEEKREQSYEKGQMGKEKSDRERESY